MSQGLSPGSAGLALSVAGLILRSPGRRRIRHADASATADGSAADPQSASYLAIARRDEARCHGTTQRETAARSHRAVEVPPVLLLLAAGTVTGVKGWPLMAHRLPKLEIVVAGQSRHRDDAVRC